MELVRTTVNRDLSDGIPVLANVVRMTNLFMGNPLIGLANFSNILKDVETVRSLLVTNSADTLDILRDLSDIADTLKSLSTRIISDLRG
jgi:hypothetical protein